MLVLRRKMWRRRRTRKAVGGLGKVLMKEREGKRAMNQEMRKKNRVIEHLQGPLLVPLQASYLEQHLH